MDSPTTKYLVNSQLAQNAWNKKSDFSTDNTLFGSVAFHRSLHKTMLVAKARLAADITDITNTYAPDLAEKKVQEYKANYESLLRNAIKRYCDKVNTAADIRIREVDKTISRTGDPSLMALISELRFRDTISDRECSAIIQRVNESGDYQAMQQLSDALKKFDKSYKPPYDADALISEIEQRRKDLLMVADAIGKPENEWTYSELMILGEYNQPTAIQESLQRLDNANGVTPPRKDVNLIDQLKQALQTAENCKDNNSANEIRRFMYDRAAYVEDRQILSEFYRTEAEALIKKVNDRAQETGVKKGDE